MLIPWSLGIVDKIDPMLARIYFWWFGHPFVSSFCCRRTCCDALAPRVAGGRLFSDPLARMAFIVFVVLSTPVGSIISSRTPASALGGSFHTVTTYAVVYPSFVTAFTVIASLEVAGRMKGARGLFNWIGRLPWADPFFSSVALSMIAFVFGGFGGVINAAYAMNAMVQHTAWIQGHFHARHHHVALSFMGATLAASASHRTCPALSVARANSAISVVRRHGVLQHELSHRRAARYASPHL